MGDPISPEITEEERNRQAFTTQQTQNLSEEHELAPGVHITEPTMQAENIQENRERNLVPTGNVQIPAVAAIAPAPKTPVEAPAASKSERKQERKAKEQASRENIIKIQRSQLAQAQAQQVRAQKAKEEQEYYEKSDAFSDVDIKSRDANAYDMSELNIEASLNIDARKAQIEQLKETGRSQFLIPEVQGFYNRYQAKFDHISRSLLASVELQESLKDNSTIAENLSLKERAKEINRLEATRIATIQAAARLRKEMTLIENALRHYLLEEELSVDAEIYIGAERNGSYKKRIPIEQRIAEFHTYPDRLAADREYRSITAALWKDMTEEERLAFRAYTENSDPVNMPLRNMEVLESKRPGNEKGKYAKYKDTKTTRQHLEEIRSSSRGKLSGLAMTQALTGAIARSKLERNTVLRRGTTVEAFAGLFGFDPEVLLENDGDLLCGAMMGQVIKDPAFTSTGIARDTGFKGDVNIRILAPRGTQGMYCDPFSAYGKTAPTELWDGETPPPIHEDGKATRSYAIGDEAEFVLQRGTSFFIESVKATGEGQARTFDVVMRVDKQEPEGIQ